MAPDLESPHQMIMRLCSKKSRDPGNNTRPAIKGFEKDHDDGRRKHGTDAHYIIQFEIG